MLCRFKPHRGWDGTLNSLSTVDLTRAAVNLFPEIPQPLTMTDSQANCHLSNGVNGKIKPLVSANTKDQTDEQAWWLEISPPFFALMESAGYSKKRQTKYAAFVLENLVPFLGPAPKADNVPHFDSFCNDDFSPVELSWNFHADTSTVRIGLEPIGRLAGTSSDPFNALKPARAMAHLLQRNPCADDKLWRHLYEDLSVTAEKAADVVVSMVPNEHMSSNTISFDLTSDLSGDPVPKVYFYPVATAISTGERRDEVIGRSLERLDLNISPALGAVQTYIAEAQARRGNDFVCLECFSFDAVEPEKSRFKLYIRTPDTSFETTQEIFTLGGRLASEETRTCLFNISMFWSLVLGTRDHSAQLQPSDHRTAGIIFNFELRHNDPIPRPKVYIPTRHYGGTDLQIAKGLGRFFRAIGWSEIAETYVEDVQRIL